MIKNNTEELKNVLEDMGMTPLIQSLQIIGICVLLAICDANHIIHLPFIVIPYAASIVLLIWTIAAVQNWRRGKVFSLFNGPGYRFSGVVVKEKMGLFYFLTLVNFTFLVPALLFMGYLFVDTLFSAHPFM